jgi:hypothetical protein
MDGESVPLHDVGRDGLVDAPTATVLHGLRLEPGRVQPGGARLILQEHPRPLAVSPGMKKILSHEFAAFAQPGALIAVLLVLLMMSAGYAAMVIAARGWPF